MKKPILYIDMDDTICDYSTSYRTNKLLNPEIKYPQSEEGFFLHLKPIENAYEVICELHTRFDVWFLTRPSHKNPLCYTEKRLWIEKYYGLEMCEKFIICPDKALLRGDYLVDDVIWKDFQGKQIQYGVDVKNWREVSNALIKEVTKIKCSCTNSDWITIEMGNNCYLNCTNKN